MPELAANSLSPDTLPNADRPQDLPDNLQHIRALASPFKRTQLITQDDGSLLIRGVPMLAAGQWTDSAVQTPLFYPEKTLSEYATNWSDTTGWSRHLGGTPRDITEKVAEATNIRYENGAITADIVCHGATQKSRDTIELVKRKLISFVSVEHTGKETYNQATRQMEASSLNFHGFAFVNRGACKLCRINEQPVLTPIVPVEKITIEPVKELAKEEDTMADFDQSAFKADLIKELSAALKPEPVKVEAPSKELEEAKAQIKELSDQVRKLAEAPPPTVEVRTKELEGGSVDFIAVFDKKAGTIRSV